MPVPLSSPKTPLCGQSSSSAPAAPILLRAIRSAIADDIVVGFQSKAEADQFRAELTERIKKCNLELHPKKTRLLELGPYAIDQRQWRGEGKPETFNFLGFTHISVKKRSNGRFTVLRQTIRKRLQTKLNEVKAERGLPVAHGRVSQRDAARASPLFPDPQSPHRVRDRSAGNDFDSTDLAKGTRIVYLSPSGRCELRIF